MTAQFDKIDERCLKIPRDPNLPRIHIDPRRPMIVIICSRYSGKLGFDEQKRDETEKASIETVLRRGRVLRGLEGATYEHICMANIELTKALPIQTKGLHPGYARHKLASILQNAKNGTQIVFVSLGLDGISSKRSGWDVLIEFQQRKGLETKLLVAEDLAQWYKAELLWSSHDWLGPIEGRYWACCDLEKLLDPASDVRLYTQILEQLEKCGNGRSVREQAIESEGRPVSGRNYRKRKTRSSRSLRLKPSASQPVS